MKMEINMKQSGLKINHKAKEFSLTQVRLKMKRSRLIRKQIAKGFKFMERKMNI